MPADAGPAAAAKLEDKTTTANDTTEDSVIAS